MKQIVKKILVAVSGSDSSINASKYAILFSKSLGVELVAVYVVDTQSLRDLIATKIFIEEESNEYEKNMVANGNRYLSYVEDLAKSKSLSVKKILKKGNIMILETSIEEKVDLIILGGWEINRSKRDLISKSHMDIMMDSKVPVLIAKEEDIENMFKKF
ncbi:MAG TPA: universal stress protein [Spirochaetota bacterium]|nr:universal stress protein [Spirochaetota bacterium]